MTGNSIRIGGNATGVFAAGTNITVKGTIYGPEPPDASAIRVADELVGLRSALNKLSKGKTDEIGRALDDADDEIKKSVPDKNRIGSAVERALKVAKEAGDFADNSGKVLPFVTAIATWLGTNWRQLLSLF